VARHAARLARHLPNLTADQMTAVHRARVACRRLREALPVAVPPTEARHKALRTLRRLTRGLGGVREMDITLQLLDELDRRPDISRAAVEQVRAAVREARERRGTRLAKALKRAGAGKIGKRLDALLRLTADAPAEGWQGTLAIRTARRSRKLVAAIGDAGCIYAPEGLHRVRIALKKLRYVLELAGEAGSADTRPFVRALKRSQDTLGRMHDLQILEHHVAAVQAGGGDPRGLASLAAQLEEECRHLHGRYTVQVPALLQLAAACRSGLPAARAAALLGRAAHLRLLPPRRSRHGTARIA
jgi:CHAD domain-containing protein